MDPSSPPSESLDRVDGLGFANENFMHFKRSARLSQPFVFTVSAFALGACGDTTTISNPPPPDSGADVATLACPPVAGAPCVVGELKDCAAVSAPFNCGISAPMFTCNDGRWQPHYMSCNPPPPDASIDAASPDASPKDGSGDSH